MGIICQRLCTLSRFLAVFQGLILAKDVKEKHGSFCFLSVRMVKAARLLSGASHLIVTFAA